MDKGMEESILRPTCDARDQSLALGGTGGTRPERIQLRRTKGWKMPPNTVKVDRSTRWGNPFSIAGALDWGMTTPAGAHAFVVKCFRAWLRGDLKADNLWRGPQSEAARQPFRDLSALRGKNLACWCRPGDPCHADVLLELANTPQTPT